MIIKAHQDFDVLRRAVAEDKPRLHKDVFTSLARSTPKNLMLLVVRFTVSS